MTSKTPEQLQHDQENADRAASLMGQHAKTLLGNPVYEATWQFLRTGILEGFASLPAHDTDTAQLLLLQVKLLDNLKKQFDSLVKAGETADDAMHRRLQEQQAREEAQSGNVFVRGARSIRGRMAA